MGEDENAFSSDEEREAYIERMRKLEEESYAYEKLEKEKNRLRSMQSRKCKSNFHN